MIRNHIIFQCCLKNTVKHNKCRDFIHFHIFNVEFFVHCSVLLLPFRGVYYSCHVGNDTHKYRHLLLAFAALLSIIRTVLCAKLRMKELIHANYFERLLFYRVFVIASCNRISSSNCFLIFFRSTE